MQERSQEKPGAPMKNCDQHLAHVTQLKESITSHTRHMGGPGAQLGNSEMTGGAEI